MIQQCENKHQREKQCGRAAKALDWQARRQSSALDVPQFPCVYNQDGNISLLFWQGSKGN